jgi:hypothetical protein
MNESRAKISGIDQCSFSYHSLLIHIKTYIFHLIRWRKLVVQKISAEGNSPSRFNGFNTVAIKTKYSYSMVHNSTAHLSFLVYEKTKSILLTSCISV